METAKELYKKITKAVMGTSKFTVRKFEIDMDKEWEIYDFQEVRKYRG